MIIFNNAGHCFLSKIIYEDPIVWVDAQDISTYTLSGLLGNELVVNGDFSDGLNGWIGAINGVISVNLGGMKITRFNGNGVVRSSNFIFDSNKNYELYYEVLENNNCTFFRLFNPDTGVYDITLNENIGVHKIVIQSKNNYQLFFLNSTDNSDITIDNVSVKEVLAYDVTNLDNKGELGGVMTLNGSVKFANGGFESWTGADYITRYLGVNLMLSSDFTMVTTFNLQDITSGSDDRFNIFSELNYASGGANYIQYSRYLSNMRKPIANSSTGGSVVNQSSYILGMQTYVCSYDYINKILNFIDENGNLYSFNNFESTYGVSNHNIIDILTNRANTINSGQNNPLHEFRLYNRAMSLVEMQDLQTELNNKYTP